MNKTTKKILLAIGIGLMVGIATGVITGLFNLSIGWRTAIIAFFTIVAMQIVNRKFRDE